MRSWDEQPREVLRPEDAMSISRRGLLKAENERREAAAKEAVFYESLYTPERRMAFWRGVANGFAAALLFWLLLIGTLWATGLLQDLLELVS